MIGGRDEMIGGIQLPRTKTALATLASLGSFWAFAFACIRCGFWFLVMISHQFLPAGNIQYLATVVCIYIYMPYLLKVPLES